MTKEEFIEYYCKRSDITEEELLKTQVVLKCNCGNLICKGWAVVSNNPDSIKAHKELYM